MASFILIHGSFHNQQCWVRMEGLLNAAGHKVLSLSFTGQPGGKPKNPFMVTALDYANDIVTAASKFTSPVIAVAHSMGGFPLAMAAEQQPELFEHLVFLSAIVPMNGRSSAISVGRGDTRSDFARSLNISFLKGSLTVKPTVARTLFYDDCSQADQNFALEHLHPQPIRPLLTKATFSDSGFGSARKSYIACTKDLACSLEFQRQLIANQTFDNVWELNCSHSPFISQPAALLGLLEKVPYRE